MTVAVDLSPDAVAKLRARAAAAGKALEVFVADLIIREITQPSLDELLAPVRDDFANSGMTEGELINLGHRAVQAARSQARNKPA